MDLTDIFNIRRADLTVYIKRAVSMTNACLSDRDPRIVVAEDTSIFLISRRIRGNLTKFKMIILVSWLQ